MLVAVAVLSLVALALLNLAGENTRTALVVEENVLAGIVADNRAVEAMLAAPGELSAHAEGRSEEHTSELQSLMRISYAVFCLKKKNQHHIDHTSTTRTQTIHCKSHKTLTHT